MKDKERYFCVLRGEEQYKFVSPIYKQAIYSGILEELPPADTPLDFFRPVNTTRYPLFQQAKVFTANVKEGDCLFVPAYYWVQSKTISDASMIINFEYESHSEMNTLLFEAIDQGILED